MLDDRDRTLLEAVEHIGPGSANVLAVHPVRDAFESPEQLANRLDELADAGALRRRELVDVVGDPVVEFDTVDGWERVLDDGSVDGR